MGEIYSEGGESFDERATLPTITAELDELRYSPPDGDPRIEAFANASYDLLTAVSDSRLRGSIEYMLRFRQSVEMNTAAGKKEEPFTAQYAVNLLLRALQHTALFRRSYTIIFDYPAAMLEYPRQFDHPEAWLREIDDILNNSVAHSVLDFDLTHRRIQSNIADRYKGIKLGIMLYDPGRFDGLLDMLDVGASLNHGLTQLIIDGKFDEVEVLYPSLIPNGAPDIIDDLSTVEVNAIIRSPLNIRSGIGVDSLPVYDPATGEWIRSCSFYPSELLDESKTEAFDRLVLANAVLDEEIAARPDIKRQIVNVNLGRLSHYQGDFSDRKSLRGLDEKAGTDKFHIVSFITMMHQLNDRERTSMIDRAKSYLQPNGLIIIQDFMNINPRAPNGLEFPAHWTEFLYKTVVIDPQRPELGPQEIVTWDYGRCHQAVLPRTLSV